MLLNTQWDLKMQPDAFCLADQKPLEIPQIWYALLVISGQERRACIWLKRRQYEPYWPRFRGPVKVNRHRSMIRWRSVIPGYLFLPIPMTKTINCELIESARQVRKVMRNGSGEPVMIPEFGKDGIARIKEMEESANADARAWDGGMPFKVGDKILIKRMTLEAKVKKLLIGKKKVVVETVFFGGMREFELPVSEIEAT